jgi:hypothetical protein
MFSSDLRVRLMATCQEPRQDLEFQLRTLNYHGGSAVRSVRPPSPIYHSRVRSALDLCLTVPQFSSV